MSAITNSLVNATPIALLTARQSGGTQTGTGQDVSLYEGHAIAILDVQFVSGTTTTMDGKLQESDTVGGTYTDIAGATFVQQTTGSSLQKIAVEIQASKKFVRFVGTFGGTTPVYNLAAYLVGQKKY
jgi:hypothetical protein